ncbi:hypothetical protein LR48_Vigan08g116500 [Vigna angularis]|uniref:Uncharacterized protein n=1 Tax=Phaseolus angularis TaxID=3914 RepID=A0A0L9V5S3_PHAAN|nr:hypothetical protein LR48_Vigan08g116500 [Vigna angularis]
MKKISVREGGEQKRFQRIRIRDGVSGYTVNEEIDAKSYPVTVMCIRIRHGLHVTAWIRLHSPSSFPASPPVWFVVGRVWRGEGEVVDEGGGWTHMRMLRRTQIWCYWFKYDRTNDLFVMVCDAGLVRVVKDKLEHSIASSSVV